MEFKDYYAVLGISTEATEQEIKQAYRGLLRKHHPDVNFGDRDSEERFKEISEAYYVLGNAERRKQYDELRHQYREWQHTQSQRTDSYGNPFVWDWFGLNFFSNFFTTVFGKDVQSRYQTVPANQDNDLEMTVDVTLEEAWEGTSRLIEVENRCIKVYIPPGVRNGTELLVEGQGKQPTPNTPPGDLYIVVKVQHHELFDREGNDLYTELPVDMYTAVMGGEVPVHTLHGDTTLTLPACTQTDRIFCLHHRGMPLLRNPGDYGNLYVRVKLFLPEPLSDDELKALRRLAKKYGNGR
jgi:curved DNA-binding protein